MKEILHLSTNYHPTPLCGHKFIYGNKQGHAWVTPGCDIQEWVKEDSDRRVYYTPCLKCLKHPHYEMHLLKAIDLEEE